MFNELEHSPTDDHMDILNPSNHPEKLDSADQGIDSSLGSERTASLTVVKIGGSTLGNHDTTLTNGRCALWGQLVHIKATNFVARDAARNSWLKMKQICTITNRLNS